MEKYMRNSYEYAELYVVEYKNPDPPAKAIFEELMKKILHPSRVQYYLDKYRYLITSEEYDVFGE
jgi:hypothetical protein